MATLREVAVIGATGAQGIPVVRDLVQSGRYSVRALTRDAGTPRFKQLESYGPVTAVTGSFASEDALRALFKGVWGAFVNIDGFNAGEKTEMFWALRAYELALEAGVQVFIYGNLDYSYKLGGYDPKYRVAHYDGKGRIGEWILFQNRDNADRMKAGLFTTGPYIEMAISQRTVMTPTVEDGVVTWRVPLNQGAIPHVALEDCGHYVKWQFDNPERASGLDLGVAIAHIAYDDLAAAFTKVTGKPAQFVNVDLDAYFDTLPGLRNAPSGYNAPADDPAVLSWQKSFSGFWAVWQNSAGNKGVVQRDYALLDEIHPDRIRSAEDYFRREEKRGLEKGLGGLWQRVQKENLAFVLKNTEPNRLSTI